jgi:hypothetical protein
VAVADGVHFSFDITTKEVTFASPGNAVKRSAWKVS